MLSKQHIQILIDQTSQDIAGFLSKDATIEWTIWAERDDWTFVIQITNNLNIVTTPREYFGPVNIKNINIQLLDEYGRVLDINNMDYSFCLTLITAYDI